MKNFLKLLLLPGLLCIGSTYGDIIPYHVQSVSSMSCDFNFEPAKCPFLFSNNQSASYNTDTKTLSLMMFYIGNDDKKVTLTIPFVNNTGNTSMCFWSNGKAPMSRCEDPSKRAMEMFAQANFDPTTKDITINQLSIVARADFLMTVHMSNIWLTPN